MCSLGRILLGVILMIIQVLVVAFVLVEVWELFIKGSQELPPLDYSTSVGVVLITSLLRIRMPEGDEEVSDAHQIAEALTLGVFAPLILLGIAHIINWMV